MNIFTPQAEWRGQETFTGSMRWLRDEAGGLTLQQLWSVRWGNNMGESVSFAWVDVPVVDYWDAGAMHTPTDTSEG